MITNQGNAQLALKQLHIIVIGAHPDDCDLEAGGTAALFAAMGHAVKFLSVTNGDAGHQLQGGGALAKRRREEAKEAGRRLGVEYEVLNNHDGELLPTLDVRLQIIRKIREWNADIVISHRPNDYHPDHRYTGMLVQDAAYMVAVPNIVPDVPALKKNPVFLYMQDRFQRPAPFKPDIAIDISEIYDKKIHALDAHQSQVYEWLPWIEGYSDEVPTKEGDREKWLAKKWKVKITSEVNAALEKWYGKEKAKQVKHAEAFEICEYGMQPDSTSIRGLFPMMNTTLSQASSANEIEKGVWNVIHTNDFKITGDGSAPDWDKTEWINLNRYNDTSNTYSTQLKILYSATGIYCLYKCEDKKISVTLKSDFLDLYNEDVIEAFFWPDESFPVYFEYELSPINYELPLLVPNKKGSFFGWLPWHYEGDRKTKHATHITKNGDNVTGWTAEFFIPFSLLKPIINKPPEKGDRWRANFYRIDYDKNETDWEWQQVRDNNFHDYERFGTIVFN